MYFTSFTWSFWRAVADPNIAQPCSQCMRSLCATLWVGRKDIRPKRYGQILREAVFSAPPPLLGRQDNNKKESLHIYTKTFSARTVQIEDILKSKTNIYLNFFNFPWKAIFLRYKPKYKHGYARDWLTEWMTNWKHIKRGHL